MLPFLPSVDFPFWNHHYSYFEMSFPTHCARHCRHRRRPSPILCQNLNRFHQNLMNLKNFLNHCLILIHLHQICYHHCHYCHYQNHQNHHQIYCQHQNHLLAQIYLHSQNSLPQIYSGCQNHHFHHYQTHCLMLMHHLHFLIHCHPGTVRNGVKY